MVGYGEFVEVIFDCFGLAVDEVIVWCKFGFYTFDVVLWGIVVVGGEGIIEDDSCGTSTCDIEPQFAEIELIIIEIFEFIVILVVVIVESFGLVESTLVLSYTKRHFYNYGLNN